MFWSPATEKQSPQIDSENVNDENLQVYRTQVAVNQYNNSNLPQVQLNEVPSNRCKSYQKEELERDSSPLRPTYGQLKSLDQCKDVPFPRHGSFRSIINHRIIKDLNPQLLSVEVGHGNDKTAEFRYTGPNKFPTFRINKFNGQPIKKQNIISLLNEHRTGLPLVSSYMDDSTEKYSDLKSACSVLDVHQARKRVHGKGDLNEDSKRRCEGLGGDPVQEGGAPITPLFVPEGKNPTLPRADQTQTSETSKDNKSEINEYSCDPKRELRKKLASKINAMSASLSSSARGFIFASRKRPSMTPDVHGSTKCEEEPPNKKARVTDNFNNSSNSQDIANSGPSIKTPNHRTSPKSSKSLDYFMSIYSVLESEMDAKCMAMKTIRSIPCGTQFARPGEFQPGEKAKKTKVMVANTPGVKSSGNASLVEPIAIFTKPVVSPLISTLSSSPPSTLAANLSVADTSANITSSIQKEEKILTEVASSSTLGFKFLGPPSSTATSTFSPFTVPNFTPLVPTTSGCSSNTFMPNLLSPSFASVTTSLAAPDFPQGEQPSLKFPTFQFTPLQSSQSSSPDRFSYKTTAPTTTTGDPTFSIGQATATTPMTCDEKTLNFTIGCPPKDKVDSLLIPSALPTNVTSPNFICQNPITLTPDLFPFGLIKTSTSNVTVAPSNSSLDQYIPSSAVFHTDTDPTFLIKAGKKDETLNAPAAATIPAPSAPNLPLYSFGQKISEPTNYEFGGKITPVGSGIIPTTKSSPQTDGSEGFMKLSNSPTEQVGHDRNLTVKRPFFDASSDVSKPLFGKLSSTNAPIPLSASKSAFEESASASKGSNLDLSKPLYVLPPSTNTTAFTSSSYSSALDTSKPVFGQPNSAASTSLAVVKPTFGQPAHSNSFPSFGATRTLFSQPAYSGTPGLPTLSTVSTAFHTKQKPPFIFSSRSKPTSKSPFNFGNATNSDLPLKTRTQENFSGFGIVTPITTESRLALGQSITTQPSSTVTTSTTGCSFARPPDKKCQTTFPHTPLEATSDTTLGSFGSGSSTVTTTQPWNVAHSSGGAMLLPASSTGTVKLPVFAPSAVSTSTAPTNGNVIFGSSSAVSATGQTIKSSLRFAQTTSIFGSGTPKPAGFNTDPLTTSGFSFGQTAVTIPTPSFGQTYGVLANSSAFSHPPNIEAAIKTTETSEIGGSAPFGTFASGFAQSSGSFGPTGFGQTSSTHPFGQLDTSTTQATSSAVAFGKSWSTGSESSTLSSSWSTRAATFVGHTGFRHSVKYKYKYTYKATFEQSACNYTTQHSETFCFKNGSTNTFEAAIGQTPTSRHGSTQRPRVFSPHYQPTTPNTIGTFSIGSGSTQSRPLARARRRLRS